MKALVVGIRETSFGGGRFTELPGVVNDVTNFASFLSQRGFDVLAPSDPWQLSASAVQDSLVRLIDTTGPGQLAVIYFTGHGYRYADTGGDEPDLMDESFVCSDQPIPDDWFGDVLWPMCKEGARVVAVIDACHSFSMIQSLMEPTPVPPPQARPPEHRSYYRLVLAACGDDEETKDFADTGGIVTSNLIYLTSGETPISYRELWSEVATQVGHSYRSEVGIPRVDYLGPDDALIDSEAFALPLTP